jgi:alkylation response protein AidB-like acyl-CoA dehydrogenase
MVDYDLSQEQKLIRQSVREFAEAEILPNRLVWDQAEHFPEDLVGKMGALGLFGMNISPEWGGQGMDTLSYIIAVEELARVDAGPAATLAAENSLGIYPLYAFGSAEQKREFLPALCRGEGLWGFGLTEPDAGSDAQNSQTKAEWTGTNFLLNGSKIFITNAASTLTMGITVQAITGMQSNGRKEVSCLLVKRGTPGFSAHPMKNKLTWRSSNTAELGFQDVSLPESALLGSRGDGFKQMMTTLDAGRLSIAAMGVGGAQGAFEAALAYSKTRRTFGKPICSHQAIAFKLADCALAIETSRELLYKACWLKDQGRPFGYLAAMAKLRASEAFHEVANHAVQIHGGYGLMEEYPVAKFYRDQRLLEIGEGTSEIQRLVIARHLGCFEKS